MTTVSSAFNETACTAAYGSSRNEQCPSLLPRNMGGTTNQMVSLDNNQFGVTGAIVRKSDDLGADCDVPDRPSDCLDDAGKVAALSRRECRGPLLGEGTLADRGLSRVDTGRLHTDEIVPVPAPVGRPRQHAGRLFRHNLSNFTARGIGSLRVTVAAITRSHDPEAPFAPG